MQNQRDKIPRKNNMQTSWPRSTTKPKKEGQWSQMEVLFVRLLLSKNISTLKPEERVSFSATDCRKLLAIMTMFGTSDDIACRRTFPWRENEKHLKRMKLVNYLDQSLYTGIQTRHIMAFSGHRSWNSIRSYSRTDLNVKCSKLWCLSLAAVLPRAIYTVIR